MNRIWPTVLAALAAGAVAAEPVTVRSGEHGAFTRLALRLPAGTDWSLSQSAAGARLAVSRPDIEFDLAGVFLRIGRNRLAAIRQSEPGKPLELDFGCRCKADAFTETGGWLVLDIRETSEPATQLPRLPIVFPDRDRIVGTEPDPDTGSLPATEDARDLNRRVSRDRLIRQFQRAFDQNILTPAGGGRMIAPPRPEDQSSGAGDSWANERKDKAPEPRGLGNLDAVTVIDRDRQADSSPATNASDRRCMPDELLSIQEWSAGAQFNNQIAELRTGLFEEFDRLDRKAAGQLARAYLYFGFGAEARAVLKLDSELARDNPALQAIAAVFEPSSPTPPADALVGQQSCPGATAFWSLMAENRLAVDANHAAIVQTVFRLPPHLRTMLAPRAAELTAEAGYPDIAKAILRAVDRAGERDSLGRTMAVASLARAEGKGETYRMLLKRTAISRTERDDAPRALVALVEKAWSDNAGLAPDMLTLLTALSVEYRGSEIGAELERAHIRALALTGDFNEAMARVAAAGGAEGDGTEQTRRLRGEILDRATRFADDMTFLVYALDEPELHPGDLSPGGRERMAARLLALGFPVQAGDLLEAAPGQNTDLRILRARAALAAGNPGAALREATGIRTEAAAGVRAKALMIQGRFGEAAIAAREDSDPEIAERAAWWSGDWSGQDSKGDSSFAQATRLSRALNSRAQRPRAGRLAEARALLEETGSIRSDIDRLLRLIP